MGGIAACCGCLCVLIGEYYQYHQSLIPDVRLRIIHSGIGLGMAVNIAILVMGWPYAFGDNQAHPNLG